GEGALKKRAREVERAPFGSGLLISSEGLPLARLTAVAEGLHSTFETATCQIPRAEQAFRDAHLTGTSKRRRLCPSRPAPARSKIAGVGARHGGFAASNSGYRGRSTRRILDNFLRA